MISKVILYLFILKLLFSSYAFGGEGGLSSNARGEILLHIGATGFRTREVDRTQRDDTTQLGYDLKVGNLIENWMPYLSANGYVVFGTTKSSFGVGSFYWHKKNEFNLNFSRTREKPVTINNSSVFDKDIVLYTIKLEYAYQLFKKDNKTWSILAGVGSNTHGEKKIFKLNRGECFLLGARLSLGSEVDPNDLFLTELFWSQDVVRDEPLKQERNSVVLRAGKRF